jgi:hypothetical protein
LIRYDASLRATYEAVETAADSCVLLLVQIDEILLPAPMKIAADASATNAISNVYSIRSWPCSSWIKLLRKYFNMLTSQVLTIYGSILTHKLSKDNRVLEDISA